MTMEWGLYDPVARAAVRLVKDAYAKLRELSGKQVPAEFAALSLSEQLRQVIVDMLEDWDRIPEIFEALRNCCSTDELDILSDLLFQQWRLFCEAYGVTKPKAVQIGPRRPGDIGSAPDMEVDEGSTKVLPSLAPVNQ